MNRNIFNRHGNCFLGRLINVFHVTTEGCIHYLFCNKCTHIHVSKYILALRWKSNIFDHCQQIGEQLSEYTTLYVK